MPDCRCNIKENGMSTRAASKRRKKRLTEGTGAPLAGGGRTKPLVSARKRKAEKDAEKIHKARLAAAQK